MPDDNAKVFISHGHNELVRLKLERFVRERLSLCPVTLADQPDDGMTVIEKLERYSRDCEFALILLTPDDETVSGGVRARQNVIHELGFFHALLGRDKVLLLKESSVELFSNISGLVYKQFSGDDIEAIFEDIRRALENRSAQSGGQTVPRREAQDVDWGESLTTVIDTISHDWPKLERRELLKELQEATRGLRGQAMTAKVERFLDARRAKLEERLGETKARIERSTADFMGDPEHGGKMAGMIIDQFTAVGPQSGLASIDKLAEELGFCKSQRMEPEAILQRLVNCLIADDE